MSVRPDGKRFVKQDASPRLVGNSGPIRKILELITRVAPTRTTVLITGESGTGKEVVARTIHRSSRQSDGPFVAVNCAAIPEALLEGELFGHARGAFTGADSAAPGLFQRANGGTILLDEIAEMPLRLQAKLLRVIEEKEVTPLGSAAPVPVRVRIVASTNRDLRRAIAEGGFREDLYYRLNVVRIHLPPLRERLEDIPLLLEQVIQEQNQELSQSYRGVTEATLEILFSRPWYGNVRELRHAIEFAMITGDGDRIRPENLPPDVVPTGELPPPESKNLSEAVRRFERAYLETALREERGNRRELATRLGIDSSTLYRKLQSLGIK